MRPLFVLLLTMQLFTSFGQRQPAINPALLRGSWSASWITFPGVPDRDYGVYHFRKVFTWNGSSAPFTIHVSADNRYRLFVNGKAVSNGPARGDLYNWYFETVDIAPFLKAGENTLAAIVWNMGTLAPVAQVSNRTAFVLQGDSEAEKAVNTNGSWKVMRDTAYSPCSTDNGSKLQTYFVVGPGDRVDAANYPWGWEQPGYDDHAWQSPQHIDNPVTAGYGTDNQWTLKPRNIPAMREAPLPTPSLRRSTGMAKTPDLANGEPFTIPANSTVSLLFDQRSNSVAYPEMIVSGGKGSSIKLTYAEALFNKDRSKGNRNDIDGKVMMGNFDEFIPDGGKDRSFRPLWFRTWRYLQLDITTGNEPLVFKELKGMSTGYPFDQKATFSSSDPSLQKIWDIGWRTALNCAGENYFDCPYYEQLQYEGDTRIQSLISLYVSGDDRLMRKALLDFYHSRVPEGLTQGRYPSNRLQVIPPFSMYWVSMIHDYWMHRQDDAFLSQFLVGAQGVLDWFEQRIDKSRNMLGPMTWWNFADWNLAFENGVPDGATDGNSSVITLQYVYTLKQAAELFDHFGKKDEAVHYTLLANELAKGTYKNCYDSQRGLMANTPEKKAYSQHASIMGILSGSIPAQDRQSVMRRVLDDASLSQATFYYRFYLTRALKYAGMNDLYYASLKPWRGMIDNGLTTFAEQPDPTRSDCHAWSSSPNYDFLATICGITPSSPGFRTVRVEPALGELTEAKGSIPHPEGTLSVNVKKSKNNGVEAEISLPGKVSGQFIWMGKTVELHPGFQKIVF